MTTIINSPTGESASESFAGIIVGVIIAIILIALFVIYGLPALRSTPAPAAKSPDVVNVNVSLPESTVNPTDTTK